MDINKKLDECESSLYTLLASKKRFAQAQIADAEAHIADTQAQIADTQARLDVLRGHLGEWIDLN